VIGRNRFNAHDLRYEATRAFCKAMPQKSLRKIDGDQLTNTPL
jgi:hypothetical protein